MNLAFAQWQLQQLDITRQQLNASRSDLDATSQQLAERTVSCETASSAAISRARATSALSRPRTRRPRVSSPTKSQRPIGSAGSCCHSIRMPEAPRRARLSRKAPGATTSCPRSATPNRLA